MARGVSLHIGLRRVDPAVFQGVFPHRPVTDNDLKGCDVDAIKMAELATGLGYTVLATLINDEATFDRVRQHLDAAAESLGPGDILLVTFSGHGNQVTDAPPNLDEGGNQDDTWVLFDQEVRDDHWAEQWLKFHPKVRIAVVLDSCSSGTAVAFVQPASGVGPVNAINAVVASGLSNAAAPEVVTLTDRINQRGPVVVLLASCADGATTPSASDALSTSPYTTTLLDTFGNGPFPDGYLGFHARLQEAFGSAQIVTIGPEGDDFRGFVTGSQPFRI